MSPRTGLTGIDNTFYIITDNYYEGLHLDCAFFSKNSKTNPLLIRSSVNIGEHTITCVLPRDYMRRGFHSDDLLSLKVSVDSQNNWIDLGMINIIEIGELSINP